MTIVIKNERALIEALQKYSKDTEQTMESVVKIAAGQIEGDAIKSIQRGTKTGALYTYDSSGKTTVIRANGKFVKAVKNTGRSTSHRASAAGEAPSSDSGELVSKIRSVTSGLNAWIGTDLKYGMWLEFGTQRMAERPWLRPARAKNEKKFFNLAKKRMGKL